MMVIAGSPAAISGIEAGDEIISIDEKPAVSLDEAKEFLSRAYGEVKFEIRRKDSLTRISVNCRQMV